MPEITVVKPSETVSVEKDQTLMQIAKLKGFNVDTIREANPKAFPLLNPEVLAPEMQILIPDKTKKKVDQVSGTSVTYIVTKLPVQFLSITITDFNNEIISAELFINGSSTPILPVERTKAGIKVIIRTTAALPDGDLTNSFLKLKLVAAFSEKEFEKQINLTIGGLDPILDPSLNFASGKETDSDEAKIAVQKILTNLGYFSGDIDGKLNKEDTRLAIARFQDDFMRPEEYEGSLGIANFLTCIHLKNQQGIQIGAIQLIKND